MTDTPKMTQEHVELLRHIAINRTIEGYSYLSEGRLREAADFIAAHLDPYPRQPSGPSEAEARDLADRADHNLASFQFARDASPRQQETPECSCAEWEPGIAKINGPIFLAQARNPHLTATPEFQFNPFRFCPWCGKKARGLDAAPRTETPSDWPTETMISELQVRGLLTERDAQTLFGLANHANGTPSTDALKKDADKTAEAASPSDAALRLPTMPHYESMGDFSGRVIVTYADLETLHARTLSVCQEYENALVELDEIRQLLDPGNHCYDSAIEAARAHADWSKCMVARLARIDAAPAREPLPPHTPDYGAPGNPKHWCERCRLEAAAPSVSETLDLRDEVLECVPKNWLDPMLSGPQAVLQAGPHGRGDDIERVLNAVRERIVVVFNRRAEPATHGAEVDIRDVPSQDEFHAAIEELLDAHEAVRATKFNYSPDVNRWEVAKANYENMRSSAFDRIAENVQRKENTP